MYRFILLFLSLSFFNSTSANHIATDDWNYIPDVAMKVTADSVSGVNVEIISTNFVFDPASVNRENRIGHGHAHLYVNSKKVARVYGHWFHISDEDLVIGMNSIRVSLNANGHEELTFKSRPIEDRSTIHYSGSKPGNGHHH